MVRRAQVKALGPNHLLSPPGRDVLVAARLAVVPSKLRSAGLEVLLQGLVGRKGAIMSLEVGDALQEFVKARDLEGPLRRAHPLPTDLLSLAVEQMVRCDQEAGREEPEEVLQAPTAFPEVGRRSGLPGGLEFGP